MMQTVEEKRQAHGFRGRIFLLLMLAVAMQLGAGWWWAVREAEENERSFRESLQRRIERISRDTDPETFMERAADRLFRALWVPGTPSRPSTVLRHWRATCPKTMAETWFFDRRGRVLGSFSPEIRRGIESLHTLSTFRDWLEHDVRAFPEFRQAMKVLHGGWPLALMSREGSLFRFSKCETRSWGIWRRAPASSASPIATAMILFHDRAVTGDNILKMGIRRARRQGMTIGVIDRGASPTFRLPPWLERVAARDTVLAFFRPSARTRSDFPREVLAAAPNRRILVGQVPEMKPVMPFWAWGAIGLWLPWLFKTGFAEDHRGRFPLTAILALVMGISAGIPLLITIAFWSWFADGRERFIRADELKRLEAAVVAIDQEFPSLLRRWKVEYRRWFDEAQATGDLEKFLKRVTRWELSRFMDSKLIIASQGARMADFSSSCINIRWLALAPKPLRKRFLSSLIDKGYHPYATETRLVWEFTPERPLRDLFSFDFSGMNSTLASVGEAVAREAIQRTDRERGFETEDDRAESVSSLVFSSLLDSEGGNPGQLFTSLIGTFGLSARGETKALIYPDIIRNAGGRGQYFSLFMHQLQTVEGAYWREVFRKTGRWPDATRLSAVSWFELSYSFPHLYEHHYWRHLRRSLKAPQRLVSGIDPRDGQLFAALACRNASHYLLIVRRPGDIVQTRMEGLRRRLAVVALVMMGILGILGWRLWSSAVLPTRRLLDGIQAMEEKRFDRRVEIATGDEWETLAATFNRTLEKMKELEVASLVQSKILLPGPLTEGGFRFLGSNLMASQVGGDYYDARPLPNGGMAFTIGDVSGHGVSAALVTGMARAAFHSLLRSGVGTPAELLKAMNELLMANLKRTKMMTLLAGFACPDGTVLLGNAGHPHPYLLDRRGVAVPVKQIGYPLGIRLKAEYRDLEIRLEAGERLVLYSDGVSEATNPENEMFGYERLLSRMKMIAGSGLSAEALIVDLQEHLRDFTRGKPWADDVTVAVLERLPDASRPRS